MNQAVLDRTPEASADVLPGDDTAAGGEAGASAPRRLRWQSWMLVLLAPIAVIALIAAVVIPQLDSGGLRAGEAELSADGGRASVAHDGTVSQVTASARVRSGDVVTAEAGSPTLALPGGSRLELRAAHGTAGSRVEIGAVPVLDAGDVLAVTKGHALKLVADGTRISVAAGGSVVHLTRANATVNVAVYRGSAHLDSAGVTATVPALRHVVVTSLRNVDQVYPLAIDTTDPWDRQYLAQAIDANHLLAPLSASFNGLFGDTELTADDLRRALPELPSGAALDPLLAAAAPTADPAGVLIGATIASLGAHGHLSGRWRQTFAFHDAGASWGLAAMLQHVTPSALNGALQHAVQRLFGAADDSVGAVTVAPPAPSTTPTAPTTPSSTPNPPPTGSGEAAGAVTTPQVTAPQTSPTSEVSPPTAPLGVQGPTSTITLPTLPAPLPQLPEVGIGEPQGGLLQTVVKALGGVVGGLLGN